MTTQIANMLKEDTGRHALDSGGAYGRHWQENQERNFQNEHPVKLNLEDGWVEYERNVYHFLVDKTEFDEEMNDRFHNFCQNDPENEFIPWIQSMEKFVKKLEEDGEPISGLYGRGHPFIHNTYNGECNLSQTLQFMYFELDGQPYVILQIHGGCDVRGGYTVPRVFKADESIFFVADGGIRCDNCGTFWRTDDNCHWYHEGGAGVSYPKENRLERIVEEERLQINKYGEGICPFCEDGVLEPHPY